MCVGYALFIYVKSIADSLLTSKEMKEDPALEKVIWSLGVFGLGLCFVTFLLS